MRAKGSAELLLPIFGTSYSGNFTIFGRTMKYLEGTILQSFILIIGILGLPDTSKLAEIS